MAKDGRESDAVVRFGVSMEEPLLKEFDWMLERQGHNNRSDALRSLIRGAILKFKQERDLTVEMAGAIVLVYKHDTTHLTPSLTALQHAYHHSIVSTMHIHLNHDRCLEVLVVRDQNAVLQRLLRSLQNMRGVEFAELVVSATTPEPADQSASGH
ncbi:MAG: nickel-responsive transcriptional regulator NikR [Alicyclobacillus sp.]|nr:nickel-responsive transcriptional regulator NikR [Alicyclobacillus sp.]